MEQVVLHISGEFFERMARVAEGSPGECVMVIRRPNGKVLLMTKEFYPQGVYRLPTGKLTANEAADEGVRREILEETGFRPTTVTRLGAINVLFRDDTARSISFTSFIFLTSEIEGTPKAFDTGECITGFREVDAGKLCEVADQLRSLSGSWSDWGKWRAVAHEFVWRTLCLSSEEQPLSRTQT